MVGTEMADFGSVFNDATTHRLVRTDTEKHVCMLNSSQLYPHLEIYTKTCPKLHFRAARGTWGTVSSRNSSSGAPASKRGARGGRQGVPGGLSSQGSKRQAYCTCLFHFPGSSTSHFSPAYTSQAGSASQAHSSAPAGRIFLAFALVLSVKPSATRRTVPDAQIFTV